MAKETTAQRLARLEKLLGGMGISLDAQQKQDIKDRADYIEHGSPEHAQFLGLVKADDEDGYVTHKGWRLSDELSAMRHYPGADPEKAAFAVLRQLVGELEAGKPPIPETAEPMWRP